MRRLLAVVLLSITAFLHAAPAITASVQSQLPPCCRANGKHKCAMHTAARPESTSGPLIAGASERCPFSAALLSTGAINSPAIPAATGHVCAAIKLTRSAVTVESEPRSAMAFGRAHPKRGPPSFLD